MNNPKIKVIVTGATGMVGEGVMHVCLQDPSVDSVLIVNRKPSGYQHPKLNEIMVDNFYNWTTIASQLVGYDACFFCLGISSVGVKEEAYTKVTYNLTLAVAKVLSQGNPQMTFCYVSGAGTDGTGHGRSMWARVKGKTENDLMKLPFRQVFAFRPGFIKPMKGLSKTHRFYAYITWMFPIGRRLFPGGFCTLQELGCAMINCVNKGYDKKIIEGKDIIKLAKG
jgi:uncharacterized protein YbjT (DUF2867 family)